MKGFIFIFNHSINQPYFCTLCVSVSDVNECVTQLVLCDINAECVNRFGSYACRCHSGFEDMSRLGSGGTICVDTKAAGMESTITVDQYSPEQQHCNTGTS